MRNQAFVLNNDTHKLLWDFDIQLDYLISARRPDLIMIKTWTWLSKGNFKREIKSLLIAAQSNTIRTNYVKVRVHEPQQSSKCRLCDDRDKTINRISECIKLAQKEYNTRHDWVGKVIHWEKCKTMRFDHTNKCYMHNQVSVIENETQTSLERWHTNRSLNLGQKTRPYNNQQKRSCKIVDFAVLADLLTSSWYLSPFPLSLIFFCGLSRQQSPLFGRSSFFLLTITRSGRLTEIRWSVCISKSQETWCVSFSRTDSALCICHLFVRSNLNFLLNFQWIMFLTQFSFIFFLC